ncbi:MAG: hypothetical protein JNL98_13710 [Bryobacterales bacterium]|nr:hypothetical protein [Bryobacterales bacterium]
MHRSLAKRLTARLSAPGARLLGILFLVALSPLDAQTPVTLPAVADSYIQDGQPNQNHGAATTVRVQDSGNNRALIRFDQAAIASAVGTTGLASAKLRLNIVSNGNKLGPDGWRGRSAQA